MNKRELLNIVKSEAASERLISSDDKFIEETLVTMFNKQAVPLKVYSMSAHVIKYIMEVGTEEEDDRRSLQSSK